MKISRLFWIASLLTLFWMAVLLIKTGGGDDANIFLLYMWGVVYFFVFFLFLLALKGLWMLVAALFKSLGKGPDELREKPPKRIED